MKTASITVLLLSLFLTSCATRKPPRRSDMAFVMYSSTFFGAEEKDVEREVYAILREAGIEPIRGYVRAVTGLRIRKKDYIPALKALMQAADQGRLKRGDVYLEHPSFRYWDEKEKVYMYEWENADITTTTAPIQ
jgi:hypothetical protein